jgi:5-methyltetrahydrofolate--homocysteine methyltransferase
MMQQMNVDIFKAILAGDMAASKEKVQEAIELGIPAEFILKEGLISAMAEVGRRFEAGDYFVPEMLISARAMKESLSVLRPLLVEADVRPAGKVVIGTVKGDLHDIGKNLVSMMLEGGGFTVVDLGVDVSTMRFIEEIGSSKVDILAMSALLTTTMPQMKATIKTIEEAGIRDQIKVIVGGAPVTESYASEIGADGFASDASRAVSLAKSLVD